MEQDNAGRASFPKNAERKIGGPPLSVLTTVHVLVMIGGEVPLSMVSPKEKRDKGSPI